jgi:hypothetical protein
LARHDPISNHGPARRARSPCQALRCATASAKVSRGASHNKKNRPIPGGFFLFGN